MAFFGWKLGTISLALSVAGEVFASTVVGDYLALNYAISQNDNAEVSERIAQQLKVRGDDTELLEQAIFAAIFDENLDQASIYAEEARRSNSQLSIPLLTLLAKAIRDENSEDIRRLSAELEIIDPIIIEAWADVIDGNREEALKSVKEAMDSATELKALYAYEYALLLANAGQDFEAAVSAIGMNGITQPPDDPTMLDYWAMKILANPETSSAELMKLYGKETQWPFGISRLFHQITEENTPRYLSFTLPRNALSDYFSLFLPLLVDDTNQYFLNRFLNMVLPLMAPEMDRHNIALAVYFSSEGEHEHALSRLGKIPNESSYQLIRDNLRFFQLIAIDLTTVAKRFIRTGESLDELIFNSNALFVLGDIEGSFEVQKKILALDGLNPKLRAETEAVAASNAQALGQWELSIELLRNALAFNPESPTVLNHLGYTLVERGININEGLDLIKKAVTLSKGEGYIIDSLGWAYYKLEHYDEAVVELETAIQGIMAYNPVVNAHLGDAYWQVGRKREAVYQWQRALDNLKEDLPDITKAELEERLENGL